jgi:hypothetical protein
VGLGAPGTRLLGDRAGRVMKIAGVMCASAEGEGVASSAGMLLAMKQILSTGWWRSPARRCSMNLIKCNAVAID